LGGGGANLSSYNIDPGLHLLAEFGKNLDYKDLVGEREKLQKLAGQAMQVLMTANQGAWIETTATKFANRDWSGISVDLKGFDSLVDFNAMGLKKDDFENTKSKPSMAMTHGNKAFKSMEQHFAKVLKDESTRIVGKHDLTSELFRCHGIICNRTQFASRSSNQELKGVLVSKFPGTIQLAWVVSRTNPMKRSSDTTKNTRIDLIRTNEIDESQLHSRIDGRDKEDKDGPLRLWKLYQGVAEPTGALNGEKLQDPPTTPESLANFDPLAEGPSKWRTIPRWVQELRVENNSEWQNALTKSVWNSWATYCQTNQGGNSYSAFRQLMHYFYILYFAITKK